MTIRKKLPRGVLKALLKDTAKLEGGERIHRIEALELYAMDRPWLAQVESLLERRMKFSLTVAAQQLYLSIGAKTLSCSLERLSAARAP